jgi:ABC-2 type transport system permease protein
MLQGIIIFVVGFFIGLRISSPLTVLYVILAMIFVGLVFAGFGLLIATKAKNIQTFQAVSMVITMPMTFLSGAYLPFDLLPNSLRWVGYFNPMTYAVALFRTITLEQLGKPYSELIAQGLAYEVGPFTISYIGSIGILAVFGVIFIALSTIAFARTDFSRMNRNKDDGMDW